MNAGPHSVVQPATWALHVLAPGRLQVSAFVKSQFPRAQKMAAFLADEAKPRRGEGRMRFGKLAFHHLPSTKFCSDPRAVFLKLSLTPDRRNHERRRNLHQAGRTDRVIQ